MKHLLFIPMMLLTIAMHAQPMVKVDVHPDTVAIGGTVEVTYTIENGEGKFLMPDMRDLPLISGPNSSSSYMYQNGKMSSTQSYSFVLLATEPGKIKIPGTTYQTGKDKLDIKPVEIIVLGEGEKPGSRKNKSDDTTSKTTREKRKF
jgi:BatD DUF11 like domain